MKKGKIIIIMCVLLSLPLAKDSHIKGGLFADFELGTRPLGMGGAFVAVVDDANSIFWNPAGLAQLNEKEISFSQVKPFSFKVLTNNCLSYAQKDEKGIGSFGILWTQIKADFSFDKEVWKQDLYIGSYAKKLTKYLSLGGNLKYYRVDSNFEYNTGEKADSYAKGYGVDIGILSKISEKISLGMLIQDIYSTIKYETDTEEKVSPVNIRIGGSYNIDSCKLIAMDFKLGEDEILKKFSLGYEYWIIAKGKKIFTKKMGFRVGITKEFFGLEKLMISSGLSYCLEKISVDYAVLFNDVDLGNMHRFSVSLFLK